MNTPSPVSSPVRAARALTATGVVLLAGCGAPAVATPPPGVRATLQGRAAPALSAFSAGHDDVLFGGWGAGGLPLGDTWVWSGGGWSQRTVTGPSPRIGAVAADDPAEHRVLLYGGRGAGHTALDDTWAWDGRSWRQLHPATVPTLGGGHPELGMGTDSAGRVVLVAASGDPRDHLGTWTWAGGDWHSAGTATVPAAGFIGPTLDPRTGRLLLLQPGPSTWATWMWDGTRWQPAAGDTTPGIAVDAAGAMSADPASGDVILVIGGPHTTTWRWLDVGWTRLHPAAVPAHRERGLLVHPQDAGMAVDPGTGRPLLVGGLLLLGLSGDTWTWNGDSWVRLSESAVDTTFDRG